MIFSCFYLCFGKIVQWHAITSLLLLSLDNCQILKIDNILFVINHWMYPCGEINFHCNIPLVEIITHSLLRWITLIAASNSYKSNWRIIFMFYCIQSRKEFKLAYNINNVFQRYVLPHFMHIYEPFYTPRIYSIMLNYIQYRY